MKKRILSMLLAIVMVVGLVPGFAVTASAADGTTWDGSTVATAYAGGTGTESDPYIIKTTGQLIYLRDQVNGGQSYNGKYFRLDSDLDMNSKTFGDAIGTNPNYNNLRSFNGHFDGNGHKISNLTITGSNKGYSALFGNVGFNDQEVVIKNLTLVNVNVNRTVTNYGSAALVGQPRYARIENCVVESGTVTSKAYYAGGLVASLNASGTYGLTIINCVNKANVTNNSTDPQPFTGGILGNGNGAKITGCTNYGTITTNKYYAGGIAGSSHNATIEKCANYGAVSSSATTGYAAGILADGTNEVVKNCYNQGSITAGKNASGITCYFGSTSGHTDTDTIVNCYNVGTINGAQKSHAISIRGDYYYNCKLSNNYSLTAGDAYVTQKTAEEFADGTVYNLLQDANTEQVWGQTIGTDSYPVFFNGSNLPKPAHEHSWSYIAKDTNSDGVNDTITATCSNADNNCPDTNGGSVTIAAPASLDYTGEAIEAVVTNNLVDTTVAVNVVYTAESGSELTEGKPVKVGTYTASITLDGATAQVTFEIKPAPVVTGIDFNRTSPAYDAATNTFYVSDDFPFYLTVTGEYLTLFNNKGGLNAAFYGDTSNAGGTWMGMTVDSDTSAYGTYNTYSLSYAITNAGGGATYINGIKVGDKQLNVKLKYAKLFTLTINSSENGSVGHNHTLGNDIPKNVEVTLNVSPNSGYELETLSINGQDVTALVSGGTYTFTMPENNVTVSATFKALPHTHDWKYELVGTSTIKAICIASGCTNTDGGSVTIHAPAGYTATTPLEYNGVEQKATLTGSFTTGESIANVTDFNIVHSTSPINVGEYTASIMVGGATASVTYSIAQKDVTIKADDQTIFYGESLTPNAVTIGGLIDGHTVTGVTLTPSITNVGTGTITPSAAVIMNGTEDVTANYNISYEAGTLTITAKEIGIKWSNTSLTYNGQAQKPTATATKLVSGDTCEITVSGEQTNAGKYTAKATELDNPNYKLPSNISTVFSIVPKTIDNPCIVLTPDSFVYDGEAKRPGVKVYDGTTEIDTNEYTFAFSNNINVSTAEAPATVTITDKDGGNYIVNGKANFTISQSAASMTAATDETSYIYGDKITVTVNISASGNAVSYGLRGTPVANQVAIYNETTQITEPKDVVDGKAVFEIDTVEAGLIPNQYTLKAVYTASSNIASAEAVTQQFTVSYLADDAEASLEGTLGENGWYTSDVTVKAPAGYSITAVLDGADTDWTMPVMVTSDGTTTVSYYLKNSSGQITGEKRIEVKRDTAAPVIGSVTVSNVTNDSAVVTVTASDMTSGMSSYALVSNDGATVTITDNGNGVFHVTGMLANKEYSFTAAVTDTAGLASSDPVFVNTSMIDISDADVTITGDYVYNGQPQVPELIVVVDGKPLISNEDYSLSYSNTNGGDGNHTDAGTVTVTITGKGDYCGDISVQFVIRKAGTVAVPVIMPGSTQFSDTLEITITCATDGAVIYYTTDGSEPTIDSAMYTAPFMITDSTTVRAFAVKANMDNSEKTAEVYEKKVDSGFDYDMWYWTLMMLYNQEFDITATATAGGTISPAGTTKVKYSKDQLYTITPNEGYMIEDVIVDGVSIGAVEVYNFDNVRKAHTITAIFAEIPWQNPFKDIWETDVYYDDVKYVYENGLMLGTGEDIFSPDITLTRAMLVTILWRVAGQPIVDSPVDFFDVPANQWYSDAIAWASADGIVLGYGDGTFGTNDPITREQLATILYRYEQHLGGGFRGLWMYRMDYDDLADVSDWAFEAVSWMNMKEIYVLRDEDLLDPREKATRAETAMFLRRFCEYREEDGRN